MLRLWGAAVSRATQDNDAFDFGLDLSPRSTLMLAGVPVSSTSPAAGVKIFGGCGKPPGYGVVFREVSSHDVATTQVVMFSRVGVQVGFN